MASRQTKPEMKREGYSKYFPPQVRTGSYSLYSPKVQMKASSPYECCASEHETTRQSKVGLEEEIKFPGQKRLARPRLHC